APFGGCRPFLDRYDRPYAGGQDAARMPRVLRGTSISPARGAFGHTCSARFATASAASFTASGSVGCACTVRFTSSALAANSTAVGVHGLGELGRGASLEAHVAAVRRGDRVRAVRQRAGRERRLARAAQGAGAE